MPADEVLAPLLGSPVAYGAAFVLGALFGSFANVCILRLPPTEEHPEGRSVTRPGSHCGACGAPIRFFDNIPILSYFLLRGRCRACGASFSPRYLLVEAATAIVFVALYHLVVGLAYAHEPPPIQLARFAILAGFALVLVIIAFIDLDHKLILNRVTYPAIPAFYVAGLFLPGRTWWDGLVGIAVGYGTIRIISDGYYFLTRREGLGYGDGKLLAVVGALFGWPAVVFTLFCGSLIGTVISLPLIGWKRLRGAGGEDEPASLRHVEVPFGPFLAMGALAFPFVERWLRVSLAGL